MRLLLYSWNANNEQILADNLIKMGFDVVWFQKKCTHYTRDMELAMEMIPFIHAQAIEAVVSFNYFPIISMICNTCQIPYYAWVYDCPHFTLYAKQVTLPCNRIGIFDREMVRRLEGYGVSTVYHVPLAADTAYFEQVIAHAPRRERGKYKCDISFVGSLYTGEHNYYDVLFNVDAIEEPANKEKASVISMGAVNMALARQSFSYRKDYLKQAIEEGVIDLQTIQTQMEEQGLMLGEDYYAKAEDILLAAVLEKKVTVEERRALLTEIAEQYSCDIINGNNIVKQNKAGEATDTVHLTGSFDTTCGKAEKAYDFRLYTNSDTKKIPELDHCNHGTVDYCTQMPLVFSESKINLNISLRSIHSGIPLRVLDIMACGGFVLSNWQPEIEENFAEGEEIVTFNSLEECLAKIAYYLGHEEERKQIALNGQKKVNKIFSYKVGLERLFG